MRQKNKEQTNSQESISKLLTAIVKEVWTDEGYTEQPIVPTLQQIQDIAIATPEPNDVLVLDPRDTIYYTLPNSETDGDDVKTITDAKGYTWTGKPADVVDAHGNTVEAVIVQTAQVSSESLAMLARRFKRTAGEPTVQEVQEVHRLWQHYINKKRRVDHPLKLVVHAWIQTQNAARITPEYNRKYPMAILKHPIGNVREFAIQESDTGRVFQTPERIDQLQMELDIGTQPSVLPDIMPLQLVESPHLKTQTKSGAVSHELRIFHEAMMALQPNQRREELMFRLGDLIDFLYPHGKFNWTNQLPHIEKALAVLHTSATIPWIDDQGTLRQWRPVSVRAPLPKDAHRDCPIFMDVVMPPDARRGHIIIKNIHRMTAMKSAARWNAYHVACYLWDKYGTVKGKLADPTRPVDRRDTENRLLDATGKPLVTRNGRAIKNPYHKEAIHQLDREPNPEVIKRYPLLNNEDLIKACYPNGYPKNNRRAYLKRAKAHWQALHDAGYVVIHKERNGLRILPPTEHLNAHRAIRKSSKGVY